MMRFLRSHVIKFFITTVLVLAALPVFAQFIDPVHVSWKASQAQVTAGDLVKVEISVAVDKGWHIYAQDPQYEYALPTEFFIWAGEGKKQKIVLDSDPKPHLYDHKMLKATYLEYSGKVTFTGIWKAVDPGPLRMEIKYQACDDKKCLLPKTMALSDPAHFEKAVLIPIPNDNPPVKPDPPAKDPAKASKKSLWSYIKLGFIGGLVALLTPCVYPMIPITISFFTKQASGSYAGQISLSLTYCLGIIVSFTGIGVVLSLFISGFNVQDLAFNPWVNGAIGLLFIFFAGSLLGYYEIKPPRALMNMAGGTMGKGGYVGAVLMGLTFAITAFTCVAPVAGGLMGSLASGADPWAPTLGMLSFSTAMALPFFFLSLFPQMAGSMPKSGGWLNSVKVIMGLVEIAAAFKFFSAVDLKMQWGLLPRQAVLASWVVCFAIATWYLFGGIRFPHDDAKPKRSPIKLFFAIGCLGFTLWLCTGFRDWKQGRFAHAGIGFFSTLGDKILDPMLPDYTYPGKGAEQKGAGPDHKASLPRGSDTWEKALARAKKTNRPLFVDFTGFI